MHIPQVNMALIFDLDRYRPVFLRPLDGSVRDVKSLRKVLEKVDLNGTLIPDWWLKGAKILITADPKVR